MEYECKICKLKYTEQGLAQTCEDWCNSHQSCNFQIAKQAINKDQARNMPISDDERFKKISSL